MTLIELLLVLVIIGVCLYVFNRVVPVEGNIRLIINAIVIIAVCIWVLEVFGLIGGNPLHMRMR